MLEITEADIDTLESEIEGIVFDNVRRNVLIDNTSFDVQACPGSGKTTLLAAKLLILSKKWQWKNKGVCVLSHTNVAKDEIIKHLKNHPTGWHFIEYPHFIGTIQEFVNKFVAIPFLRDEKLPIKSIDNDIFCKKCKSKLAYRTKAFLEKRHCSLLDLTTVWNGKKLIFKIPGFLKPSKSNSYLNLVNIKKRLLRSGYFQFREMYDFAEASLFYNTFLKEALQNRFKLVLIDEMQDTQKHQDDLIKKIFPSNSEISIIQRYGDADQAIYDGMSDEPNDSFKGDCCKYRINDSHRFSPCIANLVRGLSFSNLELTSSGECLNAGKHAECKNFGNNLIYVYEKEADAQQIPYLYSEHLARVFNLDCQPEPKAMAVGAIGKKSETALHVRIDKYFQDFAKSNQNTDPKFESMYECVAFAAQQDILNIKDNYELLSNCLLHYLYSFDVEINIEGKQINLNKTNFFSALKQDKENLNAFNRVVGHWATEKLLPSNDNWKSAIQNIFKVLNNILANIPSGFPSQPFWSYPIDEELEQYRGVIKNNVVRQKNGIPVAFDTIHGVKGQTHDATLVLETKFSRSMDVKTLIKNFSDSEAKRIDKPQSKKFMKQMYVAMSRPRKVLCLAVHKNSIAGHEEDLRTLGWKIETVNNCA
jgi:hypothetical protein